MGAEEEPLPTDGAVKCRQTHEAPHAAKTLWPSPPTPRLSTSTAPSPCETFYYEITRLSFRDVKSSHSSTPEGMLDEWFALEL